jgi:hypothetical protein
MKYACFLLLIFFVGCNENSPNTRTQKRPQLEMRDSSIATAGNANPYAAVDISPMDIAYLPSDYPLQKMANQGPDYPVARVIYSRPHRQGRTIFGGLLKYGEPWRLGANEATELELFQPVTIVNRKVAKGRYILYCIPQENKWTIVFNSHLYSWGLRPDPAFDLFRLDIPVTSSNAMLEYFTMAFEKTSTGYDLLMAWENKVAKMPIQF